MPGGMRAGAPVRPFRWNGTVPVFMMRRMRRRNRAQVGFPRAARAKIRPAYDSRSPSRASSRRFPRSRRQPPCASLSKGMHKSDFAANYARKSDLCMISRRNSVRLAASVCLAGRGDARASKCPLRQTGMRWNGWNGAIAFTISPVRIRATTLATQSRHPFVIVD